MSRDPGRDEVGALALDKVNWSNEVLV